MNRAKNFGVKLLMGIIAWFVYSFEILISLIFFERWLDLSWVTSKPLEGDPFFGGIAWLLLFLVWTTFTIFVTEVVFEHDL